MTASTWNGAVSRRTMLRGIATVAVTGVCGVRFSVSEVRAAANDKYPEEAFRQKSEADAVKALYGKSAEASDKIRLDAPEIAENGAVVPVSVSASLPDVTSIAILVTENPNALAAAYRILPGAVPSVSNRLKMAKTGNVIAVVEAGGKLYSASREVKVTVGGCGG